MYLNGDNFFMVYAQDGGAPTYRHATVDEAKTEAERLARQNPGKKFFVLMTVAVSKRVDVESRMLVNLSDIIPF